MDFENYLKLFSLRRYLQNYEDKKFPFKMDLYTLIEKLGHKDTYGMREKWKI